MGFLLFSASENNLLQLRFFISLWNLGNHFFGVEFFWCQVFGSPFLVFVGVLFASPTPENTTPDNCRQSQQISTCFLYFYIKFFRFITFSGVEFSVVVFLNLCGGMWDVVVREGRHYDRGDLLVVEGIWLWTPRIRFETLVHIT